MIVVVVIIILLTIVIKEEAYLTRSNQSYVKHETICQEIESRVNFNRFTKIQISL